MEELCYSTQTALESGKDYVVATIIIKKLTKRGVQRKWYELHHLIVQKLYEDPSIGRWLLKIGVEKNCTQNIIALPTREGVKRGFLKGATVHSGRHIDDYVKDVRKAITDIMTKHSRNELSDEEAKAAIRAVQARLREGLEAGTIALSKEQRAALAKGGVIVIAGVFILASEETADAAVCAEFSRETHKAWKQAPITAEYWFGEKSCTGWTIDLFNPIDDLRFGLETFADVSAWLEIPWHKVPVPEDGPILGY